MKSPHAFYGLRVSYMKGQKFPNKESWPISRVTKNILAWEYFEVYRSRKVIRPWTTSSRPRKMTRLDAEESYIHGLLAADKDQQHKWFLQAANLDAHFVSPAYELGRVSWKERLPPVDKVAAACSRAGCLAIPKPAFVWDWMPTARATIMPPSTTFARWPNIMPLSEVYNNLAAAEDQLNQPAAIDDYRHALDGDPNDVTYIFNLGSALLRKNDLKKRPSG